MSSPVEQAQVDKIAEALWRVDGRVPEDIGWGMCGTRNYYRRMARAAIEALQLTEETAFKYTHLASGRFTILETTDVPVARKIAGTTHELAEVSRLVGPWRTAQEKP